MSNGWTPERRQRQSEMIRQWKPWQKSTGPKTEAGKLKICQNAKSNTKHELYLQQISDLLNSQRQFQAETEKCHLTT